MTPGADLRPTRVRVERSGDRVRFAELGVGSYLRPRPLQIDGNRARLALIGSYATLLAGDRVRIEVEVGPGVSLELVEPSGTVAYDAQGGEASWAASFRLAEGAQLTWRAAPFVATGGANVWRSTTVELAPTARALISETLVLGRTYESGAGPMRSQLRVDHGGRPLLVEDLDLRDQAHRERPGVLGGHRALTSVLLLGQSPREIHGRHETRLAGPGGLSRAIAPHAHEAEGAVAQTWDRWLDEITAQGQDSE